ncbi:hypothetical protein D3C72_2380440 [compost metagenome]
MSFLVLDPIEHRRNLVSMLDIAKIQQGHMLNWCKHLLESLIQFANIRDYSRIIIFARLEDSHPYRTLAPEAANCLDEINIASL